MFTKVFVAVLLGSNVVSAQLHSLAVAAGLEYFGTAVDERQVNDAQYRSFVDNTAEFGQVVPENGQKWDSTERSQGVFTYTSGDVVSSHHVGP